VARTARSFANVPKKPPADDRTDLTTREAFESLRKEIRRLARHVTEKQEYFLYDGPFQSVSAEVRGHRRTGVPPDRLWILWQAARNVSDVGGGAADVGTKQGGSAYFIASAFRTILGHEVPVEAIDTFEGHPQDKISLDDGKRWFDRRPPAEEVVFEDVVNYLSEFELVTVHKGEFTAVAPGLPDQRYALVYIDVNLYESTLDCLRYFGSRLNPGGVMIVDDYDSPTCPGIRKAVNQFLAESGGFQSWHPHTHQLVLVKRG
jgi:O-methyltransferase